MRRLHLYANLLMCFGADLMVLGLLTNANQQKELNAWRGPDSAVGLELLRIADQQRTCACIYIGSLALVVTGSTCV